MQWLCGHKCVQIYKLALGRLLYIQPTMCRALCSWLQFWMRSGEYLLIESVYENKMLKRNKLRVITDFVDEFVTIEIFITMSRRADWIISMKYNTTAFWEILDRIYSSYILDDSCTQPVSSDGTLFWKMNANLRWVCD